MSIVNIDKATVQVNSELINTELTMNKPKYFDLLNKDSILIILYYMDLLTMKEFSLTCKRHHRYVTLFLVKFSYKPDF